MRPSALQRLAALALVLGVAVALGRAAPLFGGLWPWSDSLATALQLHHLHGSWLGGGEWSRGAFGWPLDGAVTQLDWLGGAALLTLPLHLLGVDALDEHALVCGLGLALTALALSRAARALLGPGPHTWVAALVGAFHPIALQHLPYANLAQSWAGPLGALLVGAGLAGRRPRLAALGGLVLGGAGWLGFYQASHAAFVGGITLLAAASARQGDRRSWAALAGGLLLGALGLAPVMQVYVEFQRLHGVRTVAADLLAESWDLGWPQHLGGGSTPGGGGAAVDPRWDLGRAGLLLGLGLAMIGLPGVLRGRAGPRWPWLAVLGVVLGAAILALGPELLWRGQSTGLPLPGRLLAALPGMDGLRAPVRWLGVSFAAMSLLAARGALVLGERVRLAPPLLTLALSGLLVRPVMSEPRESLGLHPIYARLLSADAPGALLDLLPPGGRTDACACHLGHRLRAAMLHGRPLVGGLYARRVQALVDLNRVTQAWPAAETVELLRRVGVGLVLEHGPAGPVAREGVRCEELGGHRLCELEPWPHPLVASDALSEVEAAPVDALRWTRDPTAQRLLTVRCDDEELRFPTRLWRLLTELQHGRDGVVLELQLGRTCERSVQIPGHPPTLLRAEVEAPTWPAP